MLNVDNYYIDDDLRKDRNDTAQGRGGGLIVYARNDILINSIRCDNNFNQYCTFSVSTKDKVNCRPLYVTFIYRSPNSTNENTLELARLIEKSEKNSLIIGDFNLPGLDIGQGKSDTKGQSILDAVTARGMENFVTFPSHVKGGYLDLVLADHDAKPNIFSVENIGNLGNSDHAVIKIEMILTPSFNKTSQKVLDWKKGDLEGLKLHLQSLDFENIFHNLAASEAWETFRKTLDDSIQRYIPLNNRRKKGDPPWMTRSVRNLVNRKQRFWKKFSKDRSDENFAKYKLAEKQCKKGVQDAKRKFERRIADSGNKRPFSSYIKSKSKARANVGPLKVNGAVINGSKEMAGILNSYFTSVYTREADGPVPTARPLHSESVICDIEFDAQKVKKKLLALRQDSAPGPDRITARFLKEFADILAPALALLYNRSMQEGSVPEDWRVANVTPIFKKGTKGDPGNYRPVSLTSIPCRVMESCIRDDIVKHLEVNNLINSSQHGFMRRKSCTTNLLEFLEKLTMEVDQGNCMDILYLDFAKAFDKVPHRRLVEKVKAHSIQGKVLNWIRSWLSNRKQRTVLNGEASEWGAVHSGVPQGSVLGPLAFVLFINDIDEAANNISIMNKFADDTKCGQVIKGEADITKLQSCIDNLMEWATTWGMSFNVSKCKLLHIGRSNQRAEYTMDGVKLAKTEAEKDIGVKVTESLKPSVQCREAAQRANNVLGQITRAFHYRDRKTFIQLYKQYVRPHLEFSIPAWSPWLVGDKEVLEKVQERAVRMVSGLQGSTYLERLKELNLPTLETRRLHFDLIQTYKILHHKDNVEAALWFDLVDSTSQRQTRQTCDPLNIKKKHAATDIRRAFFSNRVVDHWNKLPSEVKAAKSVNIFKSNVKKLVT